jgi:hypothetical protein
MKILVILIAHDIYDKELKLINENALTLKKILKLFINHKTFAKFGIHNWL